MIKVYSLSGCGKCNILKRLLDVKGIEYETIQDMAEIRKVAEAIGTVELPIMRFNDLYYSGTEALEKVQGMRGEK